jgi:hypothetical protein
MPRSLLLICLAFISIFQSCAVRPKGLFIETNVPTAPNYNSPDSWAALPDREDNADRVPANSFPDIQSEAEVDVFFLHPTTYTGDKGHDQWNGPIYDDKLNAKTDGSTILYQASIFNGTGKIYAPRYRQAHLHAYFTKQKTDARQAFELAYEDVKLAFEYYLKHYNQGRPIIIAAHSQGTTHGARLLKEFFDGKALGDQLIAAYLVGIPIYKNYFEYLKPCETEVETGCFCSWRSFKKGHLPKNRDVGDNIVVTNPLSWTTDKTHVDKTQNQGGVLLKFDKILPELADAQIHEGILWLKKPKFPGSFLYFKPNYHVADYNLYYMNVRNNAIKRTEAYLKAKAQ